MMTPDGEDYIPDVFSASSQAHSFWETCKLLARVPSPVGLSTLHSILLREDAQTYPYLEIAQCVIAQGGKLPTGASKVIQTLCQREMAQNSWNENAQYCLSNLAALHFFIEPADYGFPKLKELLPELLKRLSLWRVIDTFGNVPTKEALIFMADLLLQCDSKERYEERIIHSICSNSSPEAANVLLDLVGSGAIPNFSRLSYFIERSVAPKLAQAAVNNVESMRRLLADCERLSAAEYEAIICAILGNINDSKAHSIIYRYLDEQAYPQGGQSAERALMNRFRSEIPIEPDSNCYEVHPQADQLLRNHLFKLASQYGASQKRARTLLLRLEQHRIESGRPANESRHPNLESGKSWPACLFVQSS